MITFKQILYITLTLTWFTALPCQLADAAPKPLDEYQIKAAFLYNFAKFIQWPEQSQTDPETPFTFCFLSKKFMPQLSADLENHTIGGHDITVQHLQTWKNVSKQCQVVFIHRSMESEAKNVIKLLRGHPVLTVGDEIELASKGGVINFNKTNNKIRFEVNIDAAQSQGLKISSEMLKLAQVIKSNHQLN